MEPIEEAVKRARAARQMRAPAKAKEYDGAVPSPYPRPVVQAEADDCGDLEFDYRETRVLPLTDNGQANDDIILKAEGHPATNAYRMLRTKVLQAMRLHQWSTLAITSPGPGNGKTVTSINLALSLSRKLNASVLLVDLDLRRPSVHRLLGFSPEVGIADYFEKGVPIKDILINPGIPRLVIAPGTRAHGNSAELLASQRMEALVVELKHRYASRIILFDLPPLLATDDALAFLPYVDAALLVIEAGKTSEKELVQAAATLKSTSVIGSVLNKSDTTGTAPYDYY